MVYKEVHLKGVADLVDADVAAGAAIAKSKISTSGTWVAADIPSLDAAKIATGVLDGARGALSKAFTKNFGVVDAYLKYIYATDNFQLVEASVAAHNLLSASHGDTLAGTVVRGDLIVGNSTPAWARLAKGTANYFLVMGANDPAWTAFSDTLHGTRTNVGQHPDVVGGANGALTLTQHGALAGPSNAHRWIDILKTTSSIADITTRDHDLLAGLSDDDHTQYLLVAGTRAMTGALRMALLGSDPSLVEGMLLYRSDVDALYISYDGATKKQIFTEGQAAAEAVLFGNGYSDTLVPPNMTSTGAGTFTKDHFYGILTSGATLNDKTAAYCIWSPTSPAMGDAVYGKTPEFEISLYIPDVTTVKIWVLWGGSNNVAETAVNKRFGLKIVNTALYGLAADGSALTETDLSTALAVSTWYKIRVKHTGSAITFWKDGVLLGTTVTGNLPSGSDTAESCIQVIVQATAAADRSVRFKPMKILHGT
jgi:hypothetical protein